MIGIALRRMEDHANKLQVVSLDRPNIRDHQCRDRPSTTELVIRHHDPEVQEPKLSCCCIDPQGRQEHTVGVPVKGLKIHD